MSSFLASEAMGQTSLAENAQHFSRLDDNSMAASPRIAGCVERAVFAELDCRSAAEIKVPRPPADELVAPFLEPVELGGVGAAFAVDMGLFEVHAGTGDRTAHVHAVGSDVEDDLEDRASQANRAGAADDQARPAV